MHQHNPEVLPTCGTGYVLISTTIRCGLPQPVLSLQLLYRCPSLPLVHCLLTLFFLCSRYSHCRLSCNGVLIITGSPSPFHHVDGSFFEDLPYFSLSGSTVVMFLVWWTRSRFTTSCGGVQYNRSSLYFSTFSFSSPHATRSLLNNESNSDNQQQKILSSESIRPRFRVTTRKN